MRIIGKILGKKNNKSIMGSGLVVWHPCQNVYCSKYSSVARLPIVSVVWHWHAGQNVYYSKDSSIQWHVCQYYQLHSTHANSISCLACLPIVAISYVARLPKCLLQQIQFSGTLPNSTGCVVCLPKHICLIIAKTVQ